MANDRLLNKVHGLSDLELAGLLCLMSREHCLISTPGEALNELVEELQLIAARTFGLKCAVVTCTPQTTIDDFAASILLVQSPAAARSSSPLQSRHTGASGADSYFVTRPGALAPLNGPYSSSNLGGGSGASAANNVRSLSSPSFVTFSIANVVIAKNLDRAPKAVQIQALELLRTRRIFTRTSIQPAPKQFLFTAALAAGSGGEARVTPHLNDLFYLAHWHDPEDGFANLDEGYETALSGGEDDDDDDETASMESVVKKSVTGDVSVSPDPVFSDIDIAALSKLSREVHVDVDVLRYQMNIVSYLRMHRAVAGGVSPAATKHFGQLVKALAALHQLDYATPALVALALKKTYLHRIQTARPDQDRSLQWGSELDAVEAILEDFEPEEVMAEVLQGVAAPL